MSGGSGITSLFINQNPVVTQSVTSSGPIKVKDGTGNTYSPLVSRVFVASQPASWTLPTSTSVDTEQTFDVANATFTTYITKNIATPGVDLVLINLNVILTITATAATSPFDMEIYLELFKYSDDTSAGQRSLWHTTATPTFITGAGNNIFSFRASGFNYVDNSAGLYYYKLGYAVAKVNNVSSLTLSQVTTASTENGGMTILRVQ